MHDAGLCCIKFNLISIYSILKITQSFQYGISVFLCIDNVFNFERSTNLFKTLLHSMPSLLIVLLSWADARDIQ